MLTDIDHLMADRDLNAIVVTGKVLGNPPLSYLLKGAALSHAIIIQKRGETPRAIVSPFEREEALITGYELALSTRYGYTRLLEEHEGDELAATVDYYRRILADVGVTGRVGWYGYADQGGAYRLLRRLDEALPALEVVGEFADTLIDKARETKSAAEVSRIREVGRRTMEVVRQTLTFLQGHPVGEDETLRHADGTPLTVGDVHAHIYRLCALQGLDNPEPFIFATGRDAGIPHSRGNPAAPMRLGEPIVFDIFPREGGTGYFFDFTRTFCLGYAPPEIETLYQEVLEALKTLKASFAVGGLAREYQQQVCTHFRTRGHPTISEDPETLEGYLHSLGHGVGLDLHEAPSFRGGSQNETRLQPGHVFTVEPGLYYPDRGMGVRLEDVMWLDEEGTVHSLTDFPYTLVIPVDDKR